MEFLVIVIYFSLVFQSVNCKQVARKSNSLKGHEFYKLSSIINIFFGCVGALLVNLFLRDNNSVPQILFWFSFCGFAFLMLYGIYCLYKYLSIN